MRISPRFCPSALARSIASWRSLNADCRDRPSPRRGVVVDVDVCLGVGGRGKSQCEGCGEQSVRVHNGLPGFAARVSSRSLGLREKCTLGAGLPALWLLRARLKMKAACGCGFRVKLSSVRLRG